MSGHVNVKNAETQKTECSLLTFQIYSIQVFAISLKENPYKIHHSCVKGVLKGKIKKISTFKGHFF